MILMLSKYKSLIIFVSIAILVMLAIYFTVPVPNELSSYSVSLDGLTKSQRRNICLAARKLNNIYINPGEVFSFNNVVGPRNLESGFLPSKAIFEGETLNSVGGGICLLSSVLYNAVIRSNMKIVERVAHSKLIRSVPAGLDATVWYGINDFKFKNISKDKVKIQALCGISRLNVLIKGKDKIDQPEIIVEKEKIDSHSVQISTYRKTSQKIEKLSSDIYKI